MSEVRSVKVRLDWTRLLGFDQADQPRETATAKTEESLQIKAGPKFGSKPGIKVGQKTGVKFGIKPGIKVGLRNRS
jgi:hypothetical protein